MKTGNKEKMKIASASMLTVLLCVWIAACKPIPRNTETGTESSESFSKIYDKPDKATYTAVDIKQTDDGGYILLGKKDNSPYLLKVDKYGNFEWDRVFDEYTNPIPEIMIHNQDYYFFCTKTGDFGRRIAFLEITEKDLSTKCVVLECFDSSGYNSNFSPLDATHSLSDQNNDILLLAYYDEMDLIVMAKFDEAGNFKLFEDVQWKTSTNIYTCNYSNPFKDRRFHFISIMKDKYPNYYIFHTYSTRISYGAPPDIPCFSMVQYVRNSNNENYVPPGINKKIYYLENEPFIAAEWYGQNETGSMENYTVSAARIENHIVSFYIHANVTSKTVEKTGENENSENVVFQLLYLDLKEKQNPQAELIETSPVYIKKMSVANKEIVFFTGSSKNNRIVLYAYNFLDGTYSGKKYLGHTHIYEAAGMIETGDGGLCIIGTTYVAGRQGRLCLFKLSKEELTDMLKTSS